MTRGERLNNPGNIRIVHGTTWVGQTSVQDDPDFVTFLAPLYGIRAIAHILRSYQKDGINTVQAVINRWAPDTENNTSAYVTDVCDRCAVDPTEAIDIENLMPLLVPAIIVHENGEQIYSGALIQEAITMA